MSETWTPEAAGVLQLPSGRLVRGRGLRRPFPSGQLPEFGVYLLGRRPPEVSGTCGGFAGPILLPSDRQFAVAVLRELWERAATERVEVACGGGVGRTGTALACLAVLDGVPPDEAVPYVRQHYAARAVETPWQRRFVKRFH